MKNQNQVVKEISTHQVILEGEYLYLEMKGMDPEDKAPDGSPLFDQEDLQKYPHWFKNQRLYCIGLASEKLEDLDCLLDELQETNRILINEARQEFNMETLRDLTDPARK